MAEAALGLNLKIWREMDRRWFWETIPGLHVMMGWLAVISKIHAIRYIE